ncbi:hypothetical protein [Streptomyces kaniharaensis]|uniref:hypothetical protein n=1 Tax=Streptomyces kaniharaensis TaxID=212423 RepID=UPI001E3997B2|nr:hypothetical protein [Streptomyces kaniharaensis]
MRHLVAQGQGADCWRRPAPGVWAPTQTPSALTTARGNKLLITTPAGVVDFHTTTGRSTWALPLPGTGQPSGPGTQPNLLERVPGRW